MKINSISQKIYKNKYLLNTLEKVSKHGTSFSAGTSLILATVFRPLSIHLTPDVEKKNKNYAMANSISSGLIKFAIVEAIALPIENTINKINENPKNFLNENTLKNIKKNPKAYKLLSQVLKLIPGTITAIPKSMLTVALIPIIMDNLFKQQNKEPQNKQEIKKKVSFTGSNKVLSKYLSKIFDNELIQKLSKKFENQYESIPKHITAGTDILLTGASAYQIKNSNKIEENRKKPLIYNNIIATAITLGGGYGVDSIVKKATKGIVENFAKANANNPKLPKYLEGINIIRPILIFAGIYYMIIPIFSTYVSEKIDKFITNRASKNWFVTIFMKSCGK